jgi:hypothetical protein
MSSSADSADAPRLNRAIDPLTAHQAAAFSFIVPADTFTDQDPGDFITDSASGLPGWLQFDAVTRRFFGTPGNEDVGSSTITVNGRDTTGLTVNTTFDLTVVNTNDAPTVANAIADQAATEDQAFSFTVPANTFADADAP